MHLQKKRHVHVQWCHTIAPYCWQYDEREAGTVSASKMVAPDVGYCVHVVVRKLFYDVIVG